MKKFHSNNPRQSLNVSKVVFIVIGVCFMAMISVAAIARTIDEQENKAQQIEAQKAEDIIIKQDIQKKKKEYDTCIKAANEAYSEFLKNKVPSNLYGIERTQYLQGLRDTTESFKKDCDREYGK